jgi:hypothetical protein
VPKKKTLTIKTKLKEDDPRYARMRKANDPLTPLDIKNLKDIKPSQLLMG